MLDVQVDLGKRSYPIWIGRDAFERIVPDITALQVSRLLIVTNETVAPLYLDALQKRLRAGLPQMAISQVILPDGEQYKDLAHIQSILDAAVEAHLDRKSLIVALGGGVIGDMAGFAAAIWMRGIDFVQVPTTLLAQVDSSVGGKTGVNIPAGKNLIGAFHQPRAVFIDPEVLHTLPARQVSAGIGEIIKYGFLGDAAFVDYLEDNMAKLRALDHDTVSSVVAHCCRIKAQIVKADECEAGVRAKLNLGHTFGHAIEKLAGYGTWLHGEAVGAGTVMAAELSHTLGYISADDVERVTKLVAAAGLPTRIEGINAREALQTMKSDKKAVNGVIRFVLLRSLGESFISSVPEEKVLQVMKSFGWQ